jgi:hypothetical protein
VVQADYQLGGANVKEDTDIGMFEVQNLFHI